MFFTQCCGSGLIKSEKKITNPGRDRAAARPPFLFPASLGPTPKKNILDGGSETLPIVVKLLVNHDNIV